MGPCPEKNPWGCPQPGDPQQGWGAGPSSVTTPGHRGTQRCTWVLDGAVPRDRGPGGRKEPQPPLQFASHLIYNSEPGFRRLAACQAWSN